MNEDLSRVAPGSPEIVLRGGFVNEVVRVGDTVHRSTGPWTPAVHALLRHLETAGFSEAPRLLGIDEQGREILTYIEGQAGHRPWPTELLGEDGLRLFARLLRRYHDAVAEFVPPPGASWRIGAAALKPGEVVRHGDVGPWNSIWRDGLPVGLIDWDFAEPGPAILDLAQLAWYALPLTPTAGQEEAGFEAPPDLRLRLIALCDAYAGFEPAAVIDAVTAVQALDLSRTRSLGARGLEPWASFLSQDEVERIEADILWLAQNRGRLVQ